ncbi:hypothetical protein [Kribbella sp. NPDC004536]|uniref:hypothetical protein n=1 Tax=Kribbella sp. NPDC004536 TaxID=3364106 RepID=UPI003688AB22
MILRGVLVLAVLAAAAGCSSNGAPRSVPSTSVKPAESTKPPSPVVPAAKDGQNYKACVDGNCQVLIRKKAVINLRGDKFTATVTAGTLKLTDAKGYISLSKTGSDASRSGGGSVGGGNGGVSWNDQDGPLHVATLTYADGDTVIVNFLTK